MNEPKVQKEEWYRLAALADRLHREAGMKDFTMPAAQWDAFDFLMEQQFGGTWVYPLVKEGVDRRHFMWRHDACIRGDK